MPKEIILDDSMHITTVKIQSKSIAMRRE